MIYYHETCEDCTLNHDGCLLQENGDVEDCDLVQNYMKEDTHNEK